jgi:CheY-like chemotaxis protein/anti-sigma regulatory factor (Ser/Thr protein kinase)
LNAVIGFSEVLLSRDFGEINEGQEQFLRDIRNSGKHLLDLVNEILDWSQVEHGNVRLEPNLFRVVGALDYALTVIRERAAKHAITVTVQVADDVGFIEADELRFKQVVLNLATNAVKFTPEGGSVSIRAWREGPELVVTVTDTGIGVRPEDQERIFESFQQARGAQEEGTGLGLPFSRRMVDLFGGRMWLKSAPGAGSTFGFAIPVAFEDAGELAVPASGKQQIILVDDDRASLDLMSAYLENSATRVVRCRDGLEAIELIRRVLPAAVVLDINLPRRNGWEVLTELKADPATAGVAVIIASVVDERAKGLAMGADAYLLKPLSREALFEALRRVGALAEREES